MKRSNLKPDVQALLALVQPDLNAALTSYAQALQPFMERGLATAEQIAALTEIDYKRVNELLNELSRSSYGRPAALHSAAVRLEGQRGRSKKLYILTETGAQVLQAIFDHPGLQAPRLASAVELTAAYAIMEIYTQARLAKLQVQVEKPLFFGIGKQNVRADILVDGKRKKLFELEQAANQGTLPRAVDKLSRLHNFYCSQQANRVDHRVRMLFNLPQTDVQTLNVWREALRDVKAEAHGILSFQLYVQPLQQFLACPDWTSLDGFNLLTPDDVPSLDQEHTPVLENEAAGLITNRSAEQIDALRTVVRARERIYGKQLRAMQNQTDHALRVRAFFDIMLLIYQASHYRESPVEHYAALPVESLEMLRRFLHDEQNDALLKDLCGILEWTYDHNTGVMSMRNGYTALIWRFLKFYGFGPNGPLSASVQFPEFGDNRSDIFVEARVGRVMLDEPNPSYYISFGQKRPEELALGWVLEAMLTYPSELGIGQQPWAKKKADWRKKKNG